jgi:hypothetical protein
MGGAGKKHGEPGSIEWAVATIATSLAAGTPTRAVPSSELEDAAHAIVGALREADLDQVLMPTGVWDLEALTEEEALVFAREAVAQLFERLRVKIVCDSTPRTRGGRRAIGSDGP